MASTPSPVTLHHTVSASPTTLQGTAVPRQVEEGREDVGKKARAKIKGVIAGVVVGVVVLVAVVVLVTVVLCRMTNSRLIKTWPRPTLDLVEVKGTWTYMYVYIVQHTHCQSQKACFHIS